MTAQSLMADLTTVQVHSPTTNVPGQDVGYGFAGASVNGVRNEYWVLPRAWTAPKILGGGDTELVLSWPAEPQWRITNRQDFLDRVEAFWNEHNGDTGLIFIASTRLLHAELAPSPPHHVTMPPDPDMHAPLLGHPWGIVVSGEIDDGTVWSHQGGVRVAGAYTTSEQSSGGQRRSEVWCLAPNAQSVSLSSATTATLKPPISMTFQDFRDTFPTPLPTGSAIQSVRSWFYGKLPFGDDTRT